MENNKEKKSLGMNWMPSSTIFLNNKKRKLFEFDLTNHKDSKAGFLVDTTNESEQKKSNSVDLYYDPANPSMMQCREDGCSSYEIDMDIYNHFSVMVCTECKKKELEKYTLLTKTEVKEDYLLTEEELRDSTRVPHWTRPNPKRNTYAVMKLYLRFQVEEFSFEKWGGPEGLDAEYERRVLEKKRRKDKKIEKKMLELRRRTRTSLWNSRENQSQSLSSSHVHEFEENGENIKTCVLCNLNIEEETI